MRPPAYRKRLLVLQGDHSLDDIDLDLWDAGDDVIASSTSGSDVESIPCDLSAGSHFTRVYGYGGGSCNRYSISIDAQDVTAPVLEAPGPITLACSGAGGIPIEDGAIQAWLVSAVAEDECEGPVVVHRDASAFLPAASAPDTAAGGAVGRPGRTGLLDHRQRDGQLRQCRDLSSSGGGAGIVVAGRASHEGRAGPRCATGCARVQTVDREPPQKHVPRT